MEASGPPSEPEFELDLSLEDILNEEVFEEILQEETFEAIRLKCTQELGEIISVGNNETVKYARNIVTYISQLSKITTALAYGIKEFCLYHIVLLSIFTRCQSGYEEIQMDLKKVRTIVNTDYMYKQVLWTPSQNPIDLVKFFIINIQKIFYSTIEDDTGVPPILVNYKEYDDFIRTTFTFIKEGAIYDDQMKELLYQEFGGKETDECVLTDALLGITNFYKNLSQGEKGKIIFITEDQLKKLNESFMQFINIGIKHDKGIKIRYAQTENPIQRMINIIEEIEKIYKNVIFIKEEDFNKYQVRSFKGESEEKENVDELKSKLKRSMDREQQYENHIKQLNDQLNSAETSFSTEKQRNAHLQSKNEKLNEENTEYQLEIELLREQIRTEKEECQKKEESIKKNTEFRISELYQKQQELEQLLSNSQTENGKLKSQILSSITETKQLTSKIEDFQAHVKRLETELQKSNDLLNVTIKKFQQEKLEYERVFEAKVSALETQLFQSKSEMPLPGQSLAQELDIEEKKSIDRIKQLEEENYRLLNINSEMLHKNEEIRKLQIQYEKERDNMRRRTEEMLHTITSENARLKQDYSVVKSQLDECKRKVVELENIPTVVEKHDFPFFSFQTDTVTQLIRMIEEENPSINLAGFTQIINEKQPQRLTSLNLTGYVLLFRKLKEENITVSQLNNILKSLISESSITAFDMMLQKLNIKNKKYYFNLAEHFLGIGYG